jgi:hypothetical protein
MPKGSDLLAEINVYVQARLQTYQAFKAKKHILFCFMYPNHHHLIHVYLRLKFIL